MNFPRAVWAGSHFKNQPQMKRLVVHNEQEYVDFIKAYTGRMNCYTTVYDFSRFNTKYDSFGIEISEVNQESVILDRIFLDFDAHSYALEEALIDVNIAVNYLQQKDYMFNILFSGKGFHIYVYGSVTNNIRNIQAIFNEILLHTQDLRSSAETMLETNNGTTLDNSGIQTYRLRRIANTMNMSANLYCIPLLLEDLDKEIDEIIEMAKQPRFGAKKIYGNEKINWPNVPFATEIPNEISIVESIGKVPIVPCLQKAIMVENPTHEARVYVTSWYRDILSLGEKNISYEGKANIINLIMHELENISNYNQVWLDWDKETTRYHVRYIVDGEYSAPSCSKLISKGYCAGKCWRYGQ